MANDSSLPLDTSLLKPGMRLAVGLSGGADSVALTRALAARATDLGLVLHTAHLHHGLRGAAADADQQFVAELATSLGLQFHTARADTAAEAASSKESIEEAARRLRYSWFRQLMATESLDAVATAHTRDDQAETVLGKFLRGAWTEGLSGIHPVVSYEEGKILRPILDVTRTQVEAYLAQLNQPWREDASNHDPSFTRNRLRHQLLPELDLWNPRIREHLAHMAETARDEEVWWQAEIARLAPRILLTGRPVRGGGRATSPETSVALDCAALSQLAVAQQRRMLRFAASSFGVSLSFEATESLRAVALDGRAGQRLALPGPLSVERTARELRLTPALPAKTARVIAHHELPIPGEAHAFGFHFRAESAQSQPSAIVRNWRPGDRVTLRHSSGPRKIAEVLDRLKVAGAERQSWPVVEWRGAIVWMQGAAIQFPDGWILTAQPESADEPALSPDELSS